MKLLQIMGWIISCVLLLGTNAHSNEHEFQNFQLTSNSREIASLSNNTDLPDITIGESIFNTILNYLGPRYEDIGEDQVSNLINRSKKFNYGVQDNSGFTWQKPMGYFSIGANRMVSPHLFSDKWVVLDTFVVKINAHTYLSNLAENDQIDITKKQLAAFAGLEFSRVYTASYLTDSFMEGLAGRFDLLFLMFTHFNAQKIRSLPGDLVITKEDYLSFKAGAYGHAPLAEGLEIMGGFLYEQDRMAKLEVYSLNDFDHQNTKEMLRISSSKTKSKSLTSILTLKADFFHLLKISLLSHELTYKFSETEEIHLSINDNNVEYLDNSDVNKEFKKVLNLKHPVINKLRPFLVSRERRIEETKKSKFKLGLLGRNKTSGTEQINIDKEGSTYTFFKTSSESVKTVQGLLRGLANAFSQSFLQISLYKDFKYKEAVRTEVEYEKDKEEKFSFNITHDLIVLKTTSKWSGKRYRKKVDKHIKKMTSLDPVMGGLVKAKVLRGPLEIKTNFNISVEGINYFKSLSENFITKMVSEVCKYNSKKHRFRGTRRPGSSTRRGPAKEYTCFKKLMRYYSSYKKELKKGDDKILWKFKKFIHTYSEKIKHRGQITTLFGRNNVFINGKFTATNSQGFPFTSYFKEGEFNSAGLIEDFKKDLQISNNF